LQEEPFPGPDPYQIQLDCKVVSRKHAEIWSVGGEFYIRDNKSQSGTFLNAMRLSLPGEESKPFKLKNNDLIQLGVDYMGGVEGTNKKKADIIFHFFWSRLEGTKAVVFSCYLSFTKNIADTLSTSYVSKQPPFLLTFYFLQSSSANGRPYDGPEEHP